MYKEFLKERRLSREEQINIGKETQSRFDKQNRKKIETEQRALINLKRLKETGIVQLFEGITENESDGKSFRIDYSKENTEINLIWDEDRHINGWGSEGENIFKAITGRIDKRNRLFLSKIIRDGYTYYYNGPEALVEDNLEKLVNQKMAETEATQSQPQKRSFLNKLLGR